MNFLIMRTGSGCASRARARSPRARATGWSATGSVACSSSAQVVERVAVDADPLEVAPAGAARRQPLSDTRDLAFAKRRTPSIRPVAVPSASRSRRVAIRVVDGERGGDRRGDEVVGRGDEREPVAARAVRSTSAARRGLSAGAITSRMKRACACASSTALARAQRRGRRRRCRRRCRAGRRGSRA